MIAFSLLLVQAISELIKRFAVMRALILLLAVSVLASCAPAPKPFVREEEVQAPRGCLELRERTGNAKEC